MHTLEDLLCMGTFVLIIFGLGGAVNGLSATINIRISSARGTRVALLVQEGGEVAAYGKISTVTSTTFQGVRVAVPSKTRVIVDIDQVRLPSAAAILHLLTANATSGARRTKSSTYTLGQLKEASTDTTFSVVNPVHLLEFDRRSASERQNSTGDVHESASQNPHPAEPLGESSHPLASDVNHSDPETEEEANLPTHSCDESDEHAHTSMLEAHATVDKGKRKEPDLLADEATNVQDDILETLRNIVDSENMDTTEPELRASRKIFSMPFTCSR
ncbi:hypothetical protein B0H11DRAFT_1938651 [Mycena galericulata]|nr:hypothetical protein B0H11DRAFT_1938651 [Mycena galericulata]